MTDTWLERLTDGYIDPDIYSLALIVFAIVIGALINHIYFRWRLEPAVWDGVSPYTVRLEALALALGAGAFIAGFSGWGFLWIGGVLLVALILALMTGARRPLAIVAVLILAALAVTIAGIKMGTV